jgi:MFS family permease
MPRSYADLLNRPAVKWLLGSSLVARLPMSMTAIAVILAVTAAGGSYARAGGVMAAFVVAEGLAQPLMGRAADRLGRRFILRVLAIANAFAAVGFAIGLTLPLVPVLALAALTGATTPPIAATMRAAWTGLVSGPARQAAYALEATSQELLFIVGPSLTALLAAALSPRIALAATGVFGLVGTLVMTHGKSGRAVDAKAADQGAHHRGSALRIAALRRCMATLGLIVLALNCIELGVIAAISGGSHASALAGVVVSLWSVGSMVGGFVYGARGGSTRLPASAIVFAVAVGFGALAIAPGNRVVLSVLLVLGGTTIAPMFGRMYSEVSASVPASVITEAYSWIAVANLAGAAIGAPIGGYLVGGVGPRYAFLAGAGAVLVSAVIAHGLRRGNVDQSAEPVTPSEHLEAASVPAPAS